MKTSTKRRVSFFFLVPSVFLLWILFHRLTTETVPTQAGGEIIPPGPKLITFETLEKHANSINSIRRRPSTSAEVKHVTLAIKAPDINAPPAIKRQDRLLRGQDLERFSNENIFLPMLNTPVPDWKEKLGHELLRFQPEGVKIALAHEQSFISISGGKGRYLELVVVNYINPVNGNTAFRAFADSQTGQLIDTWDQTHSERRTPIKFTQHKD
ncbi:MAG: hypothetical protein AABY86_03225 [Bdellovibrionota bacterium]